MAAQFVDAMFTALTRNCRIAWCTVGKKADGLRMLYSPEPGQMYQWCEYQILGRVLNPWSYTALTRNCRIAWCTAEKKAVGLCIIYSPGPGQNLSMMWVSDTWEGYSIHDLAQDVTWLDDKYAHNQPIRPSTVSILTSNTAMMMMAQSLINFAAQCVFHDFELIENSKKYVLIKQHWWKHSMPHCFHKHLTKFNWNVFTNLNHCTILCVSSKLPTRIIFPVWFSFLVFLVVENVSNNAL